MLVTAKLAVQVRPIVRRSVGVRIQSLSRPGHRVTAVNDHQVRLFIPLLGDLCGAGPASTQNKASASHPRQSGGAPGGLAEIAPGYLAPFFQIGKARFFPIQSQVESCRPSEQDLINSS
jgi:hypothetical protein